MILLLSLICSSFLLIVVSYFLWRAKSELVSKELQLAKISGELTHTHTDISNLHASIEGLTNLLTDKERVYKDDLQLAKRTIEEHYKDQMEVWKKTELEKTVKESVNKSRSILRGKTTEHFAPISEEFLKEFIPSDAKFIGSPIDYIIFSGAGSITDGEEKEIEIIFMDIKTGKARLTKVQRAIKKAVEEKRIRWKTLEIT
ncbi:hypothetical protein E6Q11_05890 [Candidatus Dojkabacteria bacterium]|uniref:Holliday junction resolvase-related domain-containing protein n=1 Tax=Candidatus Dojkabacteria bacterium TaxID=2099670 RepID=A0A5C7J368_9BACT|nr:MAG: hypothetical protein E6Q11_05890 [Candidatus Dojkabacteria bacterium]